MGHINLLTSLAGAIVPKFSPSEKITHALKSLGSKVTDEIICRPSRSTVNNSGLLRELNFK